MDKPVNILSHLVKNENDTTELFSALLAYKPFREVIIRLFTKSQFGADDVFWDDIDTQIDTAGAKPDMSLLGEKVSILVEIKTTPCRGLTDNQPSTYLEWLADQNDNKTPFLIALIPPNYYHLNELESRIKSFNMTNNRKPVDTMILTWDTLLTAIEENELDVLNHYIGDFCTLIRSWYDAIRIKFTFEEVRAMYDSNMAEAIKKLMDTIEGVLRGLEQNGYTVSYSFNKRWWEGEYGGYIQIKDHTEEDMM